jgi:hypothetical protein
MITFQQSPVNYYVFETDADGYRHKVGTIVRSLIDNKYWFRSGDVLSCYHTSKALREIADKIDELNM